MKLGFIKYIKYIIFTVFILLYLYVNIKTISIETLPGIGGGWMKESSGGGEFKYDGKGEH
jgi:hypothetical protein